MIMAIHLSSNKHYLIFDCTSWVYFYITIRWHTFYYCSFSRKTYLTFKNQSSQSKLWNINNFILIYDYFWNLLRAGQMHPDRPFTLKIFRMTFLKIFWICEFDKNVVFHLWIHVAAPFKFDLLSMLWVWVKWVIL